jgi:hypothetical protein
VISNPILIFLAENQAYGKSKEALFAQGSGGNA